MNEGLLQRLNVDEEHQTKNIGGILDRIKYSEMQNEKEHIVNIESKRLYNCLENSIVLLQSHVSQMKNSKTPLINKEKAVSDNLAGTYEELVDTQTQKRFNEGELSRLRGKAMALEKEIKSNEEISKFYYDKNLILFKEIENFFFSDCQGNIIYRIPQIIQSWIYTINRDQQFISLRNKFPENSKAEGTSNLKETSLNQIDSQKMSLLKKLNGEESKNKKTDTNLKEKQKRMLIQNIQLIMERNTLFESKKHLLAQEDSLLSKIVISIEELAHLYPKFKTRLVGYLSNIYSSLDLTTGTRRSKSAIKGYKAKGNRINDLLSTAYHRNLSVVQQTETKASPGQESVDLELSDYSGQKGSKLAASMTERRKSAPRYLHARVVPKPKPILDPIVGQNVK